MTPTVKAIWEWAPIVLSVIALVIAAEAYALARACCRTQGVRFDKTIQRIARDRAHYPPPRPPEIG